MWFKTKLLLFIQNENTIYQLLLIGLFIASPSLHYLCYYNSYDPISLRCVNSALCLIALSLSFVPVKIYYAVSQYITILSFLVINNCILLSENGFAHVYLFSAVTIFIALTLFCKKRWEFVLICLLNLIGTVVAYITAPHLYISVIVLVILLMTFTFIAYVSFLVVITYNLKFKNAIAEVTELNRILTKNEETLKESGKKLNALINSLNDIIFEFDEKKVCVSVWFSRTQGRPIDPNVCIGKRLLDILGPEKAKKHEDALDFVIRNRQAVSIEFISDFGTGQWYIAKFAPVHDRYGNYTARISASLSDISEQKKYEVALKENEALLLEAQEIAKTGNWWYDVTSKETYWSASLYKILEIDVIPEGISKYDYYISLIHPDDRDHAYKYFSSRNYTGETTLEFKLITPRGNLKYFRALNGEMVTDANGNPKRSFGVLQDITGAKLAEKLIKVSQTELLEAQTIARIGNWKWDIIMNKVTCSDEIYNIFEVEKREVLETNFIKLLVEHVHPNDRNILKLHLKSIANITHTSNEYRMITRNGNIKYLSIITGKLLKRDDGTVRKIIGTIQDVTERKQAEIESIRTEQKYKLVLETIKLPAISVDSMGRLIFCNRHMADLLGYDQKEILGQNWIDFIPEGFKARFVDWFNNDELSRHNINSILCRNGDQRLISWQNTVSYGENGEIKEITGIGEDITDRQRATQALISAKEEAERSSHFKSEFLSIMSHEIRTPMNAVIGTTNLLLSEDPRPEQLEYLNTLKFSGENLLAIINDILDYNKIEAGKLELNKIPFNICHLTQKIKQSFYAKASEKGLTVELIVDDAIPQYLNGDQIRLSQIINNLLSNAVKFTHSGKVSLILNLEHTDQTHVTINFIVADTGIGIAPENIELIFDPFMQETQMPDLNHAGTGLGLAITKRLIELHESKISVTSNLGHGTQFTFTVVFEIAPKELQQTAPALSVADPARTLQGMRILAVDDNKFNLLVVSRFLKKWQAEVDEALSGAAAIDMVKNTTYDLIIMDLQMPELDGFETTRIIKTTHQQIPVIALTADAMPATHAKAFEAGMCDYLTKPFEPGVLFEKLVKYYVPVEKI